MKHVKMPRLMLMLICLALVLLLAGCAQLAQVLPGFSGGGNDGEAVTSDGDPVSTDGGPTSPDDAELPVREGYPMALYSFCGLESDPVADISYVQVNVNHCEYGEPTQTITDPAVVANLVNAASNMQVVELADLVSSTGTHIGYSFYDKDDNYIYGFSIQDGLLMESDGRYSLSGLESLFAVSGVMLPNDFEEYYEEQNRLEEAARLDPNAAVFPVSLFEAEGYHGLDYRDNCNADTFAAARVYIDWSDIDAITLKDAALAEELYAALSEIQVTGVADAATEAALPHPDRFRLMVAWYAPGDTMGRSVTFSLWNNTMESDDDVNYMLSGTERLYAIPELAEFVAYMKAYVK